ncbi:MAG: hypothetical protein Q4G68_07850 [Planctomycetia bacterium]|nr:hypothetical protein [Planctomycetia bacterium]
MNNDIRNYKACRAAHAIIFFVASLLLLGCASTNTRLFDPSGKCLFNTQNSQGAKTVADSKEKEVGANVAGAGGSTSSPWAPTTAQVVEPPRLEQTPAISWTSQRPNGAVLFPTKLTERGPLVVVEPRSIVAPIGTEVVLVSSYVGPDNEFLRSEERLEWSLDGSGHFLTTNPDMCLISCDRDMPRKNSDKFLVTKTSPRLWRVHRGTSTPLDDISILKGQSWATVQSGIEGDSSISVMANNIDDWKKRSATSQIHWIDAELFFPSSGIAPTGESRMLSTSVVRKSNPAAGREGWIVRYEILSGPDAGFGPNFDQAIETVTDASGQANVMLAQRVINAGTTRIAVKVIRPASPTAERLTIAERTVSQSWTSGAFFNVKIIGSTSIRLGQNASYQITVTNLTASSQDGVVRLPLPAGTQLVNSTPVAAMEGNVATWNLLNIPAKNSVDIKFDLNIQTTGAIDLNPRIERRTGAGVAPNVVVTPGVIPAGTPSATFPGVPPLAAPTQPNTPVPTSPPVSPAPAATPAAEVPVTFRFIDAFPSSAAVNQNISAVLTMDNPSGRAIPAVVISTQLPDGVVFVDNDDNTKTYDQRKIDFHPQPIDKITGTSFPFVYRATTPGAKTISIEAKDGNGKLLDRTTATINVAPAPSSGPVAGVDTNPVGIPATRPDIQLEIIPRGEGSPAFTTGTRVLFEFKIVNRDSYTLSGLKLYCTPERNRAVAPWALLSSIPTGATPVSSTGSFVLDVPAIAPNSETTVSMTFNAAKPVTNGIFTAEVRSDINAPAIVSREFYYSIGEKKN